jgi:TolA-binding protein
MSRLCNRSWELEPFREGRLGPKDARSLERHVQVCAECRENMESDGRLRELARALPESVPNELALLRLRTRVLRDAAAGVLATRPRRGLWAGLAVLFAVGGAAAAWSLGVHPGAPPPAAAGVVATAGGGEHHAGAVEPFAASVSASGMAHFSQSRVDEVERVELDDGTLEVRVRPQRAGERFLVALPDGEIEVRGTTFDVTVDHGATVRVAVREGVVELRLRGLEAKRISAAETWTAAAGTASEPSTATSAPHADAGHPTVPSPLTPPRSQAASPPHLPAPHASPVAEHATTAGGSSSEPDDPSAYTAAAKLLRDGRNDEAAASFHAYGLAHPSASQAEDASFLEALALARAGRTDAAALAAEHHLASFPHSFHTEDAQILIARAAAQRGECEKAMALLAPWTGERAGTEVEAIRRACKAR